MSRHGWRRLSYVPLAVALIAVSVALSVWKEHAKYADCRGAGHSLVACVARSIL